MSIPISTRTVCCKLAVDAAADAALRQTQTAFNAAASYCATVAWNQRVTNKNKLHYLVYAESRITYRLGAQLACCARDKALALEDLTHIRERVTVRRKQRRARHCWAFRQLRTFIGYKAQQAGVRVVFVEARNTSRRCAVCGLYDKRNRVDQAHFHCRNPLCGHSAAADTNAAVNIAGVAAVNQPIVSLLSHGIERADTSHAVLTAAVS